MKHPRTVFKIVEWCTFLGVDMLSYNINAVDPSYHDYTALMYAAYYDSLPTVDSLIEAGANID